MANARGKEIDKTHLSADQANIRGIIHRDLIAHCLRWSHVAKFLRDKNRYKTAVVLDIGCGVDLPLARTLHTNRMTPELYIGVDFNKTEKLNAYEHNFGDKPFYFYGNINFSEHVHRNEDEPGFYIAGPDEEDNIEIDQNPTLITCFEVLEHVEPAHARAMVEKIVSIAAGGDRCDIFISTPNWDPKVGAADNHVNEMKYEAVGYLLESCGLEVVDHWGTFASQKDYSLTDFINGKFGDDGYGGATVLQALWEDLSNYYDSNYLATIFAPLFPAQARNVLWHCRVADDDYQPVFETPDTAEPFTSSEKWQELLK